jgi:hypothetical protein
MNAVDTELRRLLQQLTLGSIVKPINLLEEREAFLNPSHPSKRRSPVFKYKDFSSRWTDFEPVLPLESIDAPEEIVEIYQEKQRELDITKKMFAAAGSDKFTQFAVSIFGFAGLIKTRLSKLGIDMDIKLDPFMTTNIWVDGVSRGIYLNQSALFAEQEVRRLLVHEVDVHAVRIHNGSCLPWGIFSMGTAGYREAEEGLAVHFERQLGHFYPFQEKIYAGRCLAVYLSLSSGFKDVFEELMLYFDEKTAYSIVERIKRGLTDTSRPGALTKEFHYFTGPDRVQSYLLNRNNIQMLMGGKIAFKHAQVISKLVQKGIIDISKWVFPVEMNDDRESIPT